MSLGPSNNDFYILLAKYQLQHDNDNDKRPTPTPTPTPTPGRTGQVCVFYCSYSGDYF